MRRFGAVARSILGPAAVLAVAALMWGVDASPPALAAWLGLAGASLAIDRRGGGVFLAGVALAALVAGVLDGAHLVASMPDQVARMLLREFRPTAPILARPMVVAVGFWGLLAALVAGLARAAGSASWRLGLRSVAGFAIAFGGFSYLMLAAWPDPSGPGAHTSSPPPLGIGEVFYHERPPVDLAEVVAVPPPRPAPPFEVRRGLAYGPHGHRNTLDLYRPRGADGPLPVVLYFHGGGLGDGGTAVADQDLRLPDVWRDALLGRGLAIAEANYRLVAANPGTGHVEVIGQYPAQVRDGLAAVRFLRAEAAGLGLDPARIGAMGHSFGGYLAAMVGLGWDRDEFATDTRRGVDARVRAVVNGAGITDLRTWGTQNRYWAKMWNLPTSDYLDANAFACRYCLRGQQFVNTGERFDPADPTLAAASPIARARPDAPPMLHVYGFRDTAIQGEMLHERLKAAGAPSRLVIIPGAGHGLAAYPGTGELMAEFLRQRLAD